MTFHLFHLHSSIVLVVHLPTPDFENLDALFCVNCKPSSNNNFSHFKNFVV